MKTLQQGSIGTEAFYHERDRRTEEYIGGQVEDACAICVSIDEAAASTPAGQLLLLGLANQLVRVHRRIVFVLQRPGIRLAARVPFAVPTLGETLLKTCSEIDPWGCFSVQAQPPTAVSVAVGIGEGVGSGYDWYLGADRALAYLDQRACPLRADYPGTLRGSALASCLGAAAVFRGHLGMDVAPRTLSAWNLREGALATPGPDDLAMLNVGRALMVGAGAIGSALAYWLYAMGVGGEWVTLDKDRVELHNTNRGLLFTASDAGWPGGWPVGEGGFKSNIISAYLPGDAVVGWYHETEETKALYDVILALANEHDVRTQIAQRNAPVVLHATTGSTWLSQLHRHIAGRDDCIRCRTRDVLQARFACSTAPVAVEAGQPSRDAALPFLSAASGLMLATALQRLQAGELHDNPWNDWRWDFASTHKMSTGGRRRCLSGCCIWLPAPVRRKINVRTRWAGLDVG